MPAAASAAAAAPILRTTGVGVMVGHRLGPKGFAQPRGGPAPARVRFVRATPWWITPHDESEHDDVALTDVRPAPPSAEAPERPTRSFLSNPWLMLLAVAGLLLTYGWTFLLHPTLVAPTRDPAWYTWRANLLLHAPPDAIVKDWGPFGMFSGGYRVTTPLLGALLMRVAGASRFTFAIVFMVGVPVLASLALAAFGYRHRRDPLLFFLTLVAGAALFLTTPYIGYMDNITCLFLLAMTLPFLQPARTSWGARTA